MLLVTVSETVRQALESEYEEVKSKPYCVGTVVTVHVASNIFVRLLR